MFFIIYELGSWSRDWPLRLAITRDWPRDSPSEFSLSVGSMGENAIIFGVCMSSSVHIDNEKKDILILGKGSTQGLDDAKLTAEAQYWTNFSRSNRKSSLSLHYNGSNSFVFNHATKIYQFKVRDCEIKKYPLCLGNITEGFSADNMTRIGLSGCVYDFSVGYRAFDTSNITDFHKCLMKKHDINWCLELLKNIYCIIR